MRMFLFLSLFALVTTACSEADTATVLEGAPETAISARTISPITRSNQEWDEFTGRFEAVQRAQIRSRVSGFIEEIRFSDGQIVEKGDILFVLDKKPFAVEVDIARSRLELRELEFARAVQLKDTNAASHAVYERRRAEAMIARSELERALLGLSWTEVRAPITGRISRNLIDAGNLVTGGDADGTLLGTIVSTSPIEFYFEGSEAYVLKYKHLLATNERSGGRYAAWPVYVRLQDEKEFVHEGNINFVDNEIDQSTGTKQIRAIFDNADELLDPGMFGRLRIATTEPVEAVMIPDALIAFEQRKKFVYIIDENSRAKRAYLTLGTIKEDGLRVVKAGLSVSDKVIAGNLQSVWDGALIKPLEASLSE